MTDTPPTPPPAAATHHERPFTGHPGRWEKERARALRAGRGRDRTFSTASEPVLVHERTRWGWLAWTVPGDGSPPEIPHQIGVRTPAATRAQRLAVRWLTRCPAQRIPLAPGSVRFSTVCVVLISLLTGLFATRHGIPVDVALPAMLLAPVLAEHIPDRLDARAFEYVAVVEGGAPCRYLQHLAALQTALVQAAAGSDRYELRRSVEVGQHVLWDAADLLQTCSVPAAAADLAARERLMVQLTDQVTQILTHTPASTVPTTDVPPPKGPSAMHRPRPAASAADVYLLFAHEPYYPLAPQEVNTSLVAAASLLHPQVRQPDGARIHECLVRRRRPGEIVPLSTLTDELDGGRRWPEVGDWEAVTADLLQLIRTQRCDALSLGLPATARALVCAGPRCAVRARDPQAADGYRGYGPADRIRVLLEVGRQLAWAEAGIPLWPGDSLLPALTDHA